MSDNAESSSRSLNDCGCCEGISVETPVDISNRPGLKTIAYRVGTHTDFKESMLASLSSSEYGVLQKLTTRDNDDFSIALLDAWATVADVLTFYQERIANESYLRTATERLSVLHLARLIGYELSPGVAASTYMAFRVEEPPKLPQQTMAVRGGFQAFEHQFPTNVTIEKGTKIQSIPGQDEKPQVFETIETIDARPEWNALHPMLTEQQKLSLDVATIYLKGINTNIKEGDIVLIITESYSAIQAAPRVVKWIESQPEQQCTRVDLFSPERCRLSSKGEAIEFIKTDLKKKPNVKPSKRKSYITSTGKVYVLRERIGFFGHNAPYYNSLKDKDQNPPYPELPNWDDTSGWEIWKDPLDNKNYYADADVYFERTIQGILPDSWVLFKTSKGDTEVYKVKDVNEKSLVGFAMSAKATGFTLEKIDGKPLSGTTGDKPSTFKVRTTTAYVRSEELKLTEKPLTENIPKGSDRITAEGKIDNLTKGQRLIISGRDPVSGKQQSEVLTLLEVESDVDITNLFFNKKLEFNYKRDTVSIYANVALATHGETVREILGSSDACHPFQRFTLKQPPLTYISASTPNGVESTLEVRVNDLLWKEVSVLYGHGSDERIYITRIDNEDKTTVQFGDGKTGARLPTGVDNVRAIYRKGIGLEGNVKAGKLSLLMTRPLGVKEVINPIDSSGADNSESLNDARRNAHLKILTLDRIVSLKDYEDFARAFAGISKALATWTWFSEKRGVFITVAGPKGAEIKEDSKTYENLLSELKKAGDLFVNVRVKTYVPNFFELSAKIKINPNFMPDKLLSDIKVALINVFSFNARDFGQPVSLSEVMAIIQSILGVIAVDVDKLIDSKGNDGLKQPLQPAMPQAASDIGEVKGAELLIIDKKSIYLGVMS